MQIIGSKWLSLKVSTANTASFNLNVTAGSFSYHRLPLTKKKTPTNNHKPTVSQIMPPVQRRFLGRQFNTVLHDKSLPYSYE